MSSFWNTSDGEDVTKDVKQEYDAGGGGFPIIPNKTNCLMSIANAGWTEDKDHNRYINIQWAVIKPDAYANTRVFQKLWVSDDDPRAKDAAKKRDKALKMLVTIDGLAGGKLAKAGRQPNDDDLALALTNKQMGCTVMVWDKEEEDSFGNKVKSDGGNWISAVWPKGGKDIAEIEKPKAGTGGGKKSPPKDDYDDDGADVPF